MKTLVVLGVIVLAGCSTTSRMDIADLNHFQIDCNRREEQIAFLQQHMSTRTERLTNGLMMSSSAGVITTIGEGTYREHRALYDRRYDAVARLTIYQIQAYCPPPQPKPQGCTTINEGMPSGFSQGKVCYQAGKTSPVIKRWEPLVD